MATKGPLYLGVDGGGTRCRARIEDKHGIVLGEGGSGPATMRLGLDKAWRSIMRACEAAAEQAGLAREEFSSLHAGIGLAGLGRQGAEATHRRSTIRSNRFVSSATDWLPASARTVARTAPLSLPAPAPSELALSGAVKSVSADTAFRSRTKAAARTSDWR